MCSHYYSAYPQFEVAEEDADEGALRCEAGLSNGRDLVEEFVAYGVWPLADGWALGEVCPRQMPSLDGMLVRSPAFALDLHSRDPAAFVREAKDGAVRIVGRYVPKTEGQRSWDIRGSNDRLNRVFELNRLPYGGYPGQDDVDRRGKKPAAETEDDPALAAAPSSKKRKLGISTGGLGVSDGFARELMRTCAAPGGRMSSHELRESSARMLRVTGGWWPKNVPIPRAASEDFFTSRMVRDWRVFPYGQNIAVTPQVLPWLEPTLALEAVITRGKGLGQHIRTWRSSANKVANGIRSITLILAHLLPWIIGEKNPRPLLNPISQNPRKEGKESEQVCKA
jgi:hypothetical protein